MIWLDPGLTSTGIQFKMFESKFKIKRPDSAGTNLRWNKINPWPDPNLKMRYYSNRH